MSLASAISTMILASSSRKNRPRTDWALARLQRFIIAALETGCRLGELLTLQ